MDDDSKGGGASLAGDAERVASDMRRIKSRARFKGGFRAGNGVYTEQGVRKRR